MKVARLFPLPQVTSQRGRAEEPFCAGAAGRAGVARCRAGTFFESESCISGSCSSTGLCPRTSKPWAISTWRTSLGDIRLLVLARPSASCRNGRQVMPPPRPLNPDSWASSVVFSSKTGFLTAPGVRARPNRVFELNSLKLVKQSFPQVRREPAASPTGSLLGHVQFPPVFRLTLRVWGYLVLMKVGCLRIYYSTHCQALQGRRLLSFWFVRDSPCNELHAFT